MQSALINKLMWRVVYRVRPAFLASLFKQLLRIKRCNLDTGDGIFWIDPISNFGQRLLAHNTYEPDMTREFLEVVSPGMSFLDCGANEGWFSVQFARAAGVGARIIAVEPQSRLQPVLRMNFKLNNLDNVEIVNAVVASSKGMVRLFLAPDVNTGSSGLAAQTRYSVQSEAVPSVCLSELLDTKCLSKVDVMKVDVEGFEHEVVLGSRSVFEERRIRHLFIEFHDSILKNRGLDAKEIQSFLKACGYSPRPGAEFHWSW